MEKPILKAPKMKERPAKEYTPGKARLYSALVTAVFAVVFYYLYLPALNIKAPELYVFLGCTVVFYLVARIKFSGKFSPQNTAKDIIQQCWGNSKLFCLLLLLVVAAALVGGLISNPVVAAQKYHALLDVQDGDFVQDVYSISYDEIPALDNSSAAALGNRALGELSDLVSQFEAESTYTQINYKGSPTRIACLKYDNIVKWFTNRQSGLPGYVMVDMVSQSASVVRVEGGIRYSPSERFGRDLTRYLRFQYPTFLFDDAHMEIDDEGTAWWICPVLDKTIGLFGGSDVIGAVVLDATTGESTYYDSQAIPQWIDQIYSSDLLISQYDFYGKYGDGFFNSLLGQAGVTKTTEGSNYIALNDDVYMYTGITSVSADQSNIGFILCNQRTKETRYYAIPGATEQSAMSSATGAVQHLNYTATFPLLLNVSDQPTYFIALKDNADLVKMYAMVNVSQYQLVATGSTILECEDNYRQMLTEAGVEAPPATEDTAAAAELSGIISRISSCVVGGNSIYYIELEGSDLIFEVSAAQFPHTAIAQPGDTVTLRYPADDQGRIRTALSVTLPWDEP